jgi:hypothetical protein
MNSVYARFAKEGAKFHIGIVYATQSPAPCCPICWRRPKTFLSGHLSSQIEVETLCQLQLAFQGCENAIRYNRTPGLVQMLTHSHRFVRSPYKRSCTRGARCWWLRPTPAPWLCLHHRQCTG